MRDGNGTLQYSDSLSSARFIQADSPVSERLLQQHDFGGSGGIAEEQAGGAGGDAISSDSRAIGKSAGPLSISMGKDRFNTNEDADTLHTLGRDGAIVAQSQDAGESWRASQPSAIEDRATYLLHGTTPYRPLRLQ